MDKTFHILGQLSDEHVEWLAENGVHRVAVPGESVILEGVVSKSLFFLLDGEMSVTVCEIGEVARLKSIDIIGEMSLVEANSVPSATVTALNECVLLEVPKSVINEKMEKDVFFAARFYRAIAIFLSDRLRSNYRDSAMQKN